MGEAIQATTAALEVITRLEAAHGPLMFFQSACCCDGSAPLCLEAGELPVGPQNTRLQRAFLERREEAPTACALLSGSRFSFGPLDRPPKLRRRDQIAMIRTREYGCSWTVADQADQLSLQLTFAVAATSRRD